MSLIFDDERATILSANLSGREKKVYSSKIKEFLPDRIIDFHVHVGLKEHSKTVTLERRKQSIGIGIAYACPIENLLSIYDEIFENKEVHPFVVPFPQREAILEKINMYVASITRKYSNTKGALLVDPDTTSEYIERTLTEGYFKAFKPYPDRVLNKKGNDVEVYDCINENVLNAASKHRMPIFLHVPKEERLASKENLREIREICDRYPEVTMVIAHMGRLHCPPSIEEGIDGVSDLENVYFDTSMITNPYTFTYALRKVGPEKLVFGTDMPSTLTRGKIICIDGRRVWAVKESYPWVKDEDRKLYEKEMDTFIPLVYEDILALKKALKTTNLMSEENTRKIFYENASEIAHL